MGYWNLGDPLAKHNECPVHAMLVQREAVHTWMCGSPAQVETRTDCTHFMRWDDRRPTLCSWHNVCDLPSMQLGSRQSHGPCAIHHHRLEVIRLVKGTISMRVRANDDLQNISSAFELALL